MDHQNQGHHQHQQQQNQRGGAHSSLTTGPGGISRGGVGRVTKSRSRSHSPTRAEIPVTQTSLAFLHSDVTSHLGPDGSVMLALPHGVTPVPPSPYHPPKPITPGSRAQLIFSAAAHGISLPMVGVNKEGGPQQQDVSQRGPDEQLDHV
jgi:hypothetical protein